MLIECREVPFLKSNSQNAYTAQVQDATCGALAKSIKSQGMSESLYHDDAIA